MKARNIVGVALIAVVVAATVIAFMATLFKSTTGEIAQSLGNVIGAGIGTAGAFAVAMWTLKQSAAQEKIRKSEVLKIIRHDLDMYIIQILFMYTAVNRYDYPDGRITPQIVDLFALQPLPDFADNRRLLLDIGSDLSVEIEYVYQATRALEKRLAELKDGLSDETQRSYFVQLDYAMNVVASALEKISPAPGDVFAKQAKATTVFEYLPFPPEAFQGKPAALQKLHNDIASAHHKAR